MLTLKKARVFSSLYLPKCIDMALSLSFIEGIMPGGLSIRFSLQPPQCSKCQCSLGEKQQGLLAEAHHLYLFSQNLVPPVLVLFMDLIPEGCFEKRELRRVA